MNAPYSPVTAFYSGFGCETLRNAIETRKWAIMDIVDLLPNTASNLERDLVKVIDRNPVKGINAFANDSTMPAKHLYDPDRVAASLLPYVAYVLSVDYWDDDWSEEQKRSIVRNAYKVQSKKGTIQSVKEIIEALGFTVSMITENVDGHWAKFSVTISETITNDLANDLRELIERTTPLRNELVSINFNAAANAYDGTILYDGSVNYGAI